MDFNALRLHMQDAPAWYDLLPTENGIAVSVHPAEYTVAMDIMTKQALSPDYGKELDVGPFFFAGLQNIWVWGVLCRCETR